MNYKVIKNFLDKDRFQIMKQIVMDPNFAWFFRGNNEIKAGYFSHSLFNDHRVNSNFNFDLTDAVYDILKPVSIIQARVNLNMSPLFKNKKGDWHVDYPKYNNLTAIFYFNNTNGGTELKDKGKIKYIKDEENKILIMKGDVFHRSLPSTDVENRYIMNLNYFTDPKNMIKTLG